MTTAVQLKAYGDFLNVSANRDGTGTTHVGKRVILTEVVVDGRVVCAPRMLVQHEGNMLAIPVCVPTEHGMEIRFDQWELYDMLRDRLLPQPIRTLDPHGGALADVALRYVLEARRLPDDGLAVWMTEVAAGLEAFA